MACHSVVWRMVKSTNELLVVRVCSMVKEVRLTDVAPWLTEPGILCCTHYTEGYVHIALTGSILFHLDSIIRTETRDK